LKKPLILITGASSGIGFSLVDLLKDRFEVVAVARRVERMTGAWGDRRDVHPYALDLSEAEQVEGVMNRILERHGSPAYLVNNAGVLVKKDYLELSLDEATRSMQVNALAPFQILKKLLPAMVEKNFGRVVHVTSGAPLNCFPAHAAYSASKGALNAMTVTVAREQAERDIKINLMSPGPCKTEMAPHLPLSVTACHPTLLHLLDLKADGPTGRFFWLGHEVPLFPDLQGVAWEEGKANGKLKRILP
jgi:NAD(P)-dependent dehydrogenase (short-subunit alcohol dehydrogenase family)